MRGLKRVRSRLLRWYARAARKLPWRATRDPYRIWVSEIMLQQTRVAVVIPYYRRFVKRFPNVQALAAAREEDVLALWSGLGYYSRARNLHKAARQVAAGGLPRDSESLRALPGVGAYTAAAIASIAFNQPRAVLDGNVLRVLSRLTEETGDVRSAAARKRLEQWAERLLERKAPGRFNQALMELGATVCLPRNPKCATCPIAADCLARRHGTQDRLPVRRRPLFGQR